VKRPHRPFPLSPWRLRRALVVVAIAMIVVASGCSNSQGSASQATAGEPGGAAGGAADGTATAGGAFVAVDAPGVTDHEIRFDAIGTREGNPLGTCLLDCFLDGVDAYFAYRNSEGGVHGRQLVLGETFDDQLARNQEVSLEVVSNDEAFGVFDVPLVATGYEDLDAAGIPTYTWAINFTEMAGREAIFGNGGVICVTCVERSPVYAAEQVGATKVAVLGYGVAKVSKECVAGQVASIDRFGDAIGVEVAYVNDELPFGLPNGIGPEVTAMKEAGVDFVISCWELNGGKTVEQELERQGMGDVPQMNSNLYDASFVADSGGLFDGAILRMPIRPFESSSEGALATYRQWMEQTGSELTELSMYGWVNADLAYQGLLVAGPDFDRSKVIAATNAMTAYDADGLVNPVDWSRQHEPPTDDDPVTHGYARECYSFVRVVGGRFELIGDPDRPFQCWPVEAELTWSEPEASDLGR
jgi:branched-chain amino acid transport system substrate-binding protein